MGDEHQVVQALPNQAVLTLALQMLVAAGHVTQAKVDEAIALAYPLASPTESAYGGPSDDDGAVSQAAPRLDAPMSIPEIHAAIREAGGIVHGDGNVFFTNAERFIVAAVLCGECASLSVNKEG